MGGEWGVGGGEEFYTGDVKEEDKILKYIFQLSEDCKSECFPN